jgi:2-oxoglutarate ferredoxin oxidoreductase subunit gamma
MNDTTNIRIAGFGGQGVMMVGQMIAYASTHENLNALWSPSYGPETRGGTANCAVIVSQKDINSPVFHKSHHLLAFSYPSLNKFKDFVAPGGFILYNSSLIQESILVDQVEVIGVPINDMALELGNPQVINMIMLGAYLEKSHLLNDAPIHYALKYILGERKAHLVDINVKAIEVGRQFIRQLKVPHA